MSISERPQKAHGRTTRVHVSIVVAIPVRNERDKIAACLDALASQTGILPGSLGLLLFLNNCTDGTRQIVEASASKSPWPMRVLEEDFVAATAGWARGRAMDAAADWLDFAGSARDSVLLTTDADSRVGTDWVARNLAALAAGADAVAGRFAFDREELATLPDPLRARLVLEATYESLLAEIDTWLDPQPGDPWPSHWTKSGATIAVRLAAYRRIGGLPRCDSGEDRALIDAIRANGLVVRHDPDIVVLTSSRRVGRARGGCADTLQRWSDAADEACDHRLERLDRMVLRTLRRRWRRIVWRKQRQERPYRPLRPSQLPGQIFNARLLLGLIRQIRPRSTSSRYASVRAPLALVDQLRAAPKKPSAASSPVKG